MSILKLKELLNEKGVTGKELADKIGISVTGMSNIVKGQSLPRQDVLLLIADTLDVDVKDLFNSTKPTETETIFVLREGSYVPVGQINKLQ
jgi:transcriptional regulator with XRE-family HTH domain